MYIFMYDEKLKTDEVLGIQMFFYEHLYGEEIEVFFFFFDIYLLWIYSVKPSAISEQFRQMDFASLGKLIKN